MSGRAEGWTATAGQGASEAEIRAGQRLWDAVSDPEWRATDENLVFMSRAPFSVAACVEVLQAALGTGQGAGARWTWGTEALVAACTDRADELARAATRADEGLGVAVRWALARRARATGEPLSAAALRTAAAWFVAPLPDPDPRQPDAWWPGWEQVWDPAAWWAAVVEAMTDLKRPVATSPRLRRAWHHADEAQRPVLLCRLFPGGPRWAQGKSAELERAAWDPLMDVAEALQRGDLTAAGPAAESLRAMAPGVAVVLTSLSARLDRDLEPGFHAAVLRAAVEHNRSLDAIEPINEALRRLPEEHRQRIMLEAPYLRWRHLPAVPTQTVIDWAVGEVAALSARSFQTMERAHPEGSFHFGHTPDELKLIAAEALGAAGDVAVPFLIDGLSRAPDVNKVVFATALAVQRSGEAIPVLVHALAHGSTAVREVVQEGLAAFGDALLPELEPLLKDDRRAVRAAAALVLSRMEPSGDVRQLAGHALLDEDGPEIRATLASVADAPVRPPELVDVEAREAAVPRGYRRALAESLRATDGRAWRDHLDLGIVALGLVADWYADQVAAGRADAAELFLDAVGLFASDPGTPWVLARIVDHPRFEPAWLSDAADLVGPDLVKPLAWRSRSGPPERRRAMLKALVALHPAGGVRELIRSMTSPDAEVRRTCQEGLRAAGDAAVPALREALQSEDALVRQQAALALERLPDPANAAALRGALASESDTLTAWVLQRALAVSAIESGPAQDRALDRMLAQQRGQLLGSYVVEMALPTLTWRSGVPFSTEARSWLLNGIVSIAERVDWFLPISHTARLVWAIRRRMDDRSTLALLDDLRRQARGLDPHDTAPLLAVATALLAPESEIEGLAARISDPAWAGPSVGGRRIIFPDGDPRVLFLRGSAGALRATMDLAAWSGHSLVLAWAREAVRRLREGLSVTATELDAAVRPPRGWTVGQARQELARRLRTGEALPLVRWLQELRDPTLGRVASSLVFDSLDREGRVRDRFRWRLGVAQDPHGEPVVVGDSVRLSDPLDWHPDEKEAWRAVLPEGSQPISQCYSSPMDGETDHEVLDTGWLPTALLARRLQAAGYHWLGIEEATPGGREVFPPSPALRAMRPLEDGWAARLDTTIVRSLSDDSPDPPVARVVRWSALSPARTGGWRERPRGELPWMLRRQVYGELAWIDRDSDRESATEFMPVLASQAERATPAEATKPADVAPADTALVRPEPPRRAAKSAPPEEDKPKGFFAWLFRDRKNEREAAERERELAEAKARREEARRRADEARRRVETATVAEVQRKRDEQRQRSERWGSVEEALVEARAARATRLKVEAEERRAAHRSAAEREAGGLLLRRLVRDLEAVGGASGVAGAAGAAGSAEARQSEPRKPALREVREVEPAADEPHASGGAAPTSSLSTAPDSTPDVASPDALPAAPPEPEVADEAHAAVARWLAERARRAAGARQQARQRLQAQREGAEATEAGAPAPEVAPRAAAVDTVRKWQAEREAEEEASQAAAAAAEEEAEAKRRDEEAQREAALRRREAARLEEAEARQREADQRAAEAAARQAALRAADVPVATVVDEPEGGGFLDLMEDEPAVAPKVSIAAVVEPRGAGIAGVGLAALAAPLQPAAAAAPTLAPPDDDDWFLPAAPAEDQGDERIGVELVADEPAVNEAAASAIGDGAAAELPGDGGAVEDDSSVAEIGDGAAAELPGDGGAVEDDSSVAEIGDGAAAELPEDERAVEEDSSVAGVGDGAAAELPGDEGAVEDDSSVAEIGDGAAAEPTDEGAVEDDSSVAGGGDGAAAETAQDGPTVAPAEGFAAADLVEALGGRGSAASEVVEDRATGGATDAVSGEAHIDAAGEVAEGLAALGSSDESSADVAPGVVVDASQEHGAVNAAGEAAAPLPSSDGSLRAASAYEPAAPVAAVPSDGPGWFLPPDEPTQDEPTAEVESTLSLDRVDASLAAADAESTLSLLALTEVSAAPLDDDPAEAPDAESTLSLAAFDDRVGPDDLGAASDSAASEDGAPDVVAPGGASAWGQLDTSRDGAHGRPTDPSPADAAALWDVDEGAELSSLWADDIAAGAEAARVEPDPPAAAAFSVELDPPDASPGGGLAARSPDDSRADDDLPTESVSLDGAPLAGFLDLGDEAPAPAQARGGFLDLGEADGAPSAWSDERVDDLPTEAVAFGLGETDGAPSAWSDERVDDLPTQAVAVGLGEADGAPPAWSDELVDDFPTEAVALDHADDRSDAAVLEPLDSRFNDGLALPVGALLDLDDARPGDLTDVEDDWATVTPPDRDDPTESWTDEPTEAWVEEVTAHVDGPELTRTDATSATEGSLDAATEALVTLEELTLGTDDVDAAPIVVPVTQEPRLREVPPAPVDVAPRTTARRSARELRVLVSRALASEARATEAMEFESALVEAESEAAAAAFARWKTARLTARARVAARDRALASGEIAEEPYESTADISVWQREAAAFAQASLGPEGPAERPAPRTVVVEDDEEADLPWLEEDHVSRSLADGFVDDDIVTDLLNIDDGVEEATLRLPRLEPDPLEERTESFHRLPEGSWTVFDPDDSDAADGQATQVIRAVDLREPDEERTASIRGDLSWTAEYTVPVIEPDWPRETTATDVERYVPVVEIQDSDVGDAEVDTVSPEVLAALRRGEIAKPAEGVGGMFKRLWKRFGG